MINRLVEVETTSIEDGSTSTHHKRAIQEENYLEMIGYVHKIKTFISTIKQLKDQRPLNLFT